MNETQIIDSRLPVSGSYFITNLLRRIGIASPNIWAHLPTQSRSWSDKRRCDCAIGGMDRVQKQRFSLDLPYLEAAFVAIASTDWGALRMDDHLSRRTALLGLGATGVGLTVGTGPPAQAAFLAMLVPAISFLMGAAKVLSVAMDVYEVVFGDEINPNQKQDALRVGERFAIDPGEEFSVHVTDADQTLIGQSLIASQSGFGATFMEVKQLPGSRTNDHMEARFYAFSDRPRPVRVLGPAIDAYGAVASRMARTEGPDFVRTRLEPVGSHLVGRGYPSYRDSFRSEQIIRTADGRLMINHQKYGNDMFILDYEYRSVRDRYRHAEKLIRQVL